MRFQASLAIICAFALSMCRAEEENSDVVVLTTDTFDDFVKEHKYVLAEFYAPWCGHCKALAPEYEKAATALKESNSDVKLAKIDATVEKDLGTRFAVQGYPTLLWFVSGDKFEYKGGRTADTIIQWISKKTGPAVGTGEVPTPAGQAVVVLKGKTITNDFNKVANALGDDAVFHFIESDAADVIEIHHKEEDLIVASDSDKADLAAFVNKHLMPKFGNLDGETYGKYMSSGKGLVWVLMDIASSEELAGAADAARPTFIKLAKKFPQYNFAYIDTVMFKAAVENMLGVSEFPAIAVNQKAGDKKKFILPGELEEATISKFLNDVEAGKVEPTLKSEEVPESNEEPVRVIVGKTLKEEVFVADKDVLFEVYAPWCGHCKKLAPEYEKVAQKIRKEGLEDLITIAKMDGTTNDSPIDSISWEGFPTLFYIKAGSTEPEPFNGGRDAKSIWKWIKKNHSKSDEIAKRLAEKKDESKEDSSEEGKDEL